MLARRRNGGRAMTDQRPLLEVTDLVKHYAVRGGVLRRRVGTVHAVDGVSFSVGKGETLGLVGESGCGKSTVARSVLRLVEPSSGAIKLNGIDIIGLSKAEMRPHRRSMQIVFQDPFASLNPRRKAAELVAQGPIVHGAPRTQAIAEAKELFALVGLDPSASDRFPHEFSGGQRQRIGVARTLALNPKLIVADEPVSALDVSVQAQVVNLLQDLQKEFGLAYLFISHGLAVVEHISNRVAVMYLGRIVEVTTAAELYANPLHPYTKALLSAIPVPDPKHKRERIVLQGDVPTPINPPSGCRFRTRCPIAIDECARIDPELREISSGHTAACIRVPGWAEATAS